MYVLLIIFLMFILFLFTLKNKRWPLYVFVSLYPILPDYFGINLGFLVLTMSRLLILLLFTFYLFRSGKIRMIVSLFKNTVFTTVLLFFICIVGINIYHMNDTDTSINMIIQVFFEQFLVTFILSSLVIDKTELIKILKTISITSGIVSIMGVIESITSFNLAYLLKTVDSMALQTSYERLGFLRAEVSFGHPVYFGFYCLTVFVVSIFLYNFTKKNIYFFISFLNILALILSGSRGSIFSFGLTIITILLISPLWLTNYLRKVPMVFLILLFLGITNPAIFGYAEVLFKSTLNSLGFNYQIDNFGTNAKGTDSRLAQLSLFEYLKNQNKYLFGLGAKAQVREVLYYKYEGLWQVSNTYDIGYLSYFGDYGIVGFLGFILLNMRLLLSSLSMKLNNCDSHINSFFLIYMISYIVNLLSSANIHNTSWVIISLFIAYQRIRGEENKNEFESINYSYYGHFQWK